MKLVGATAHYVTEELDEGPIIEQDVVRVSHAHTTREVTGPPSLWAPLTLPSPIATRVSPADTTMAAIVRSCGDIAASVRPTLIDRSTRGCPMKFRVPM